MARRIAVIAFVVEAGTGAGASLPPAPPSPPPVVIQTLRSTLVEWQPGDLTCDGQPVDGANLVRPMGELRPLPPKAELAIELDFAIDADGRTLSITPRGNGIFGTGSDVPASLAASRFAVGAARSACTVRYEARITPISEASVDDLLRFSMKPGAPRLPTEARARVEAARDCFRSPRPQALSLKFPDYRSIPQRPGDFEWTVVDFAIGADGAPAAARTAMGTQNQALDEAALAAVRGSRFAEGARAGCMAPFVRFAGTLPAPKRPTVPDGPPACDPGNWTSRPRLNYPEPYRRRSIEGWAVVKFDIAPWGEVGNVEVINSQPSADFGKQAQFMMRTAKAKSGPGASGCRQLVRFEMRDGGLSDEPAG